jgi:hypothetical protein
VSEPSPEHVQPNQTQPNQVAADRRWRPTGDAAEWVERTRDSIFASATRCIAHAMSLRSDAPAGQSQPSDTVLRELRVCTEAYAKALYALGQTPDGAAALILAAARRAVQPEELQPPVVTAIDRWCREADLNGGADS